MKSRENNGNLKILSDLGFHFPKEHGFSVIFLSSIVIGILISLKHSIDSFSFTMTILFVFIIFFSNTSIIEGVKSKFHSIHVVPYILIAILGIYILMNKFTLYNILTLILISISFIIWMLLNFINRGHSSEELILGTLTLTLFIPLIYINTTPEIILMNDFQFIWIIAIWWLVSGFTSHLILYVQYMRKKIMLRLYTLSWILFLISLFPIYYIQYLSIITLIVLLEPSYFIIRLNFASHNIPEKLEFKKIGRILTFRLLIYIIILTGVIYL